MTLTLDRVLPGWSRAAAGGGGRIIRRLGPAPRGRGPTGRSGGTGVRVRRAGGCGLLIGTRQRGTLWRRAVEHVAGYLCRRPLQQYRACAGMSSKWKYNTDVTASPSRYDQPSGIPNFKSGCFTNQLLQWNLQCILDTVGEIIIESLSSFKDKKCGLSLYRSAHRKVSFIQRCPLITESFTIKIPLKICMHELTISGLEGFHCILCVPHNFMQHM